MAPTARATLMLVTVNLAVYFLMLAGWLLRDFFPELPEMMTSFLALPDSLEGIAGKPWTTVTYMFTHLNFVHLTVNMLWLLGFGPMIKGSWQHTAGTYLAGGLFGMIAYLLASIGGNAAGELAGASASVIAVVIATACLSPGRKLRLIFVGEVKLKWISLIAVISMFAGADILSPVTAAHLGGAVGGALVGFVLRRLDRELSHRAMETARRHTHRLGLIQKVGRSGFASLSEPERLELFDMRNRH